MNASANTHAIPLHVLLGSVWRHRLIALSTGVVVLGAVIGASFLITPLYRADTLLVVERGGHPINSPTDESDATNEEYSLLNTESELLHSNQVITQVLARDADLFNKSKAYANSRDRVELLHSRITLETNQYNWIIHVSLMDADRALAVAALNTLIACHLEDERQRIEDRSRSATDFLSTAVTKARDDLATNREAEAKFRRDNGLLSTDPDHNQLTDELETLNASRTSLETDVAASTSTMAALKAGELLSDPAARLEALMRVPGIHTDPVVQQLQQAELAAEDHVTVLSAKYKAEHPQMIDAVQQATAARAQLAEAVAVTRDALTYSHQQLLGRLHSVNDRIAAAETGLATYRDRIMELQALSLRTASSEQLYETVDHNLQEEEIASHRAQLNVSVADPPHVTSWPVNVKRILFALAGVFLGAVAAVCAAQLAELLDRRIRDFKALRQLTSLPVLAGIPHVPDLGIPGGRDTLVPASHGLLVESFRLLGSTIQLGRDLGNRTRVIVVTSPSSGDGRTAVAARLALSLANGGNRVLLIDGDLRQGDLHRQFKLPEEAGLSDLLQDREAVVVPTGHERLELLSAGTPAGRSLSLMDVESFRELLATFSGNNRFVIIDSPPLEFSESLVMCGLADDILMVVREGFTGKESLRLAQLRLGPLMPKVLGLVVNDDHGMAPLSKGAASRILRAGLAALRRPDIIRLRPQPRSTREPIDEPVVIEGL